MSRGDEARAARYNPTEAEKLADQLLQGIAFGKPYSGSDDYIRDAAAMLRRLAKPIDTTGVADRLLANMGTVHSAASIAMGDARRLLLTFAASQPTGEMPGRDIQKIIDQKLAYTCLQLDERKRLIREITGAILAASGKTDAILSLAPVTTAVEDMREARLVADGEPVALADCPPGPFAFNGTLAFRTEYGAMSGKDVGGGKVEWAVTHWPDAYCLDTGETFWGGAKTREERSALIVQPLAALLTLAPSATGEAGNE